MTRLVDLNPHWLGHGGEGVLRLNAVGAYEPTPRREGVGVLLDCPCGNRDEGHQLYVPFENPLDGGPGIHREGSVWQRTGDTFDALTLTPSILRMDPGGCRWHGYITDGAIVHCDGRTS